MGEHLPATKHFTLSETLILWLTITLVMYGAYPLIMDGIFGTVYALIVIVIAVVFTTYITKGKLIPIPVIRFGKE
jgi:hypothetical protein